ncbi:hypothetical protein [Bacillus sp. WP8]|uniref:hypothetical protein n=1 Tax=Bacillus sp. WP8 TaxID=756828 RepID=UPI0021B6B66A|nr:hypothetical protein [Bacillus sp. WP8]
MILNSTFMGITAIVTMVIWVMVSAELTKSTKKKEEKNNSRRKLIVLMSAGMLFTIFLVLSSIQNIQF